MMQVLFSNHYEYHSARFHGGVISRGAATQPASLSPPCLATQVLCGPVQGLTVMFSFKILLGFQLEMKRSLPSKAEPTKQSPSEPFTDRP